MKSSQRELNRFALEHAAQQMLDQDLENIFGHIYYEAENEDDMEAMTKAVQNANRRILALTGVR